MKRNVQRVVFVGIFLALCVALVYLVYSAHRQERLDVALVQAVNKQDARRVDILLAAGADPNTRDQFGHPPPPWYWGLLHALHLRKQPVPPPYLGPSVLMIACYDGDVKSVRSLVAHGADVNKRGEQQWPAFFFTSSPCSCLPMQASVVAVRPYQTITQSEVQRRLEIMGLLFSHGATVNSVCYQPDHTPATPLVIAAELNETSAALWLLNHGANPNFGAGLRFPPLHLAVNYGNLLLVKALLAAGADPNLRDNGGETPLFDIESSDHPWAGTDAEIAKLLVSHKADVNARDTDGLTILMGAVAGTEYLEVRFLLKAGANVNVKDNGGNTALSFALGNPRLVRILKQAGAKK